MTKSKIRGIALIMRIAVIGSGYVGLVSAVCFAEIGHNVISVDNDGLKIAALERGGNAHPRAVSSGVAGATQG